jgi:hypothetical protein
MARGEGGLGWGEERDWGEDERRAVVGVGRRQVYLCWPPPSSSPAWASQRKKTRLKVRNESVRGYEPIPALIRRLGGVNHGIPTEGIRAVGMEFGLNSRPNFLATPNARIRTRIPEFWIPGSILSNQTGYKSLFGYILPPSGSAPIFPGSTIRGPNCPGTAHGTVWLSMRGVDPGPSTPFSQRTVRDSGGRDGKPQSLSSGDVEGDGRGDASNLPSPCSSSTGDRSRPSPIKAPLRSSPLLDFPSPSYPLSSGGCPSPRSAPPQIPDPSGDNDDRQPRLVSILLFSRINVLWTNDGLIIFRLHLENYSVEEIQWLFLISEHMNIT